MSKESSISIKLYSENNLKSYTILDLLINFGWSCCIDNSQIYLPLNDNDEWNWLKEPFNFDNLKKIIISKSMADEVLGVKILWRESNNIGGILLIYPDLSVTFSLIGNRVEDQSGVTDFSWYIGKLIPAIINNNINIIEISCSEYY